MYLFDVFLKIIKAFHLVDSDGYNALKQDVKSWEENALSPKDEGKDKTQLIYKKIHKGVLARLAMPILYFFALKNLSSIMTPEKEEGLY
ncbi:hypothetical protein [Christiangramia sp. SM2212]|uniref:Uncharacterized protein n=1 Tax=Christiangramia sediminicola TaxID=3073267 RepID=A0ABU1EPC7_9FLAO|nr:hypothetical protein [Christiangramia sp. SM2212]MDR5590251.1 hypothetical protein [Christiangramia sp. SM2212]